MGAGAGRRTWVWGFSAVWYNRSLNAFECRSRKGLVADLSKHIDLLVENAHRPPPPIPTKS